MSLAERPSNDSLIREAHALMMSNLLLWLLLFTTSTVLFTHIVYRRSHLHKDMDKKKELGDNQSSFLREEEDKNDNNQYELCLLPLAFLSFSFLLHCTVYICHSFILLPSIYYEYECVSMMSSRLPGFGLEHYIGRWKDDYSEYYGLPGFCVWWKMNDICYH